jgi:MraZ protein
MAMFRGQYEHAIDEKGRTSLPARFRAALEDAKEVILVPALFDPCVEMHPLDAWQELEEKVAALPRFDPNAIQLRRRYLSAAVPCDLDKQGRVLIPASHREYAGLAKDAWWNGVGKYVELWSKARFDASLDLSPDRAEDFKAFVGQLSL